MKRKRRGRPPAGVGMGERVKDYPQLSVRVPPVVIHRLNALSRVRSLPQWRIVSRALERLMHDLSPGERRMVEEEVERRRRRGLR